MAAISWTSRRTLRCALRPGALAALAGWVLLALGGCAAPATPERAPARLALVIGNAAYSNAQPLNNPVNDAQDMCRALQKLGFATLCHRDVGSREDFARHVDDYIRRLGPATVGVVFYAGHGVQVAGSNFLVPTQAQPDGAGRGALQALYGLDELFERLRERPARLNIVMLDACRTELFAEAPRAPATRGAGPATASTAPTASRLLRELKAIPRSATGLAALRDAPPRTLVLYATASKSAAFDGDGRNGPLTRHVLRHIGTRGQSLDAFFSKVIDGVENETLRDFDKRQSPFIYGSFAGRFCFAGCPGDGIEVPPIN